MSVIKLKLNHNMMESVAGVTNEYPYTMHYDEHDHIDIPWHWHEEVEFNYVISGEITYVLTDRTVTVKEGQGCFLNSNVLARIDAAPGAISICHIFHPVILAGYYKSIFETKYISPVIQNKKVPIVELKGESLRQQNILKKLRQLKGVQDLKDHEFHTRNLLSDIWLELISEIEALSTENLTAVSVNQERLMQMLSFIHNNYDKKLTLEQIASAAAISTRECSRCFAACMKETPIEYLMQYRIQVAQTLLRTTNMSILDVAMESGFSNSAYFTKVFKQVCGVTPKQYKNNFR